MLVVAENRRHRNSYLALSLSRVYTAVIDRSPPGRAPHAHHVVSYAVYLDTIPLPLPLVQETPRGVGSTCTIYVPMGDIVPLCPALWTLTRWSHYRPHSRGERAGKQRECALGPPVQAVGLGPAMRRPTLYVAAAASAHSCLDGSLRAHRSVSLENRRREAATARGADLQPVARAGQTQLRRQRGRCARRLGERVD